MKPKVPKDSSHNIHCQQIDGKQAFRPSSSLFLARKPSYLSSLSSALGRLPAYRRAPPPHSWLARMSGHSRGAGISQSRLQRTGLAQAVENSAPICCWSQQGEASFITTDVKSSSCQSGDILCCSCTI